MLPQIRAACRTAAAYVAASREGAREGMARGLAEGPDALHATGTDRAQMGAGNLIGLIIGISIAVIVGVGVGIPITNDVIAQSNLSGITALVVGFIPVMLGLMIFVATAAPIMART